MEPFFFGRERELFGCYHGAEGNPRRECLLIAGPVLNEGIRTHYALRQIAERCAAGGYDVLRFDYSGLGHSPGRSESFGIDDWSGDLLTAAEELTRISGYQVTAAIAVRFGAWLMTPLLRERVLDRLVLWDPLLSGQQWLESLREWQRKLPAVLQNDPGPSDSEFMGHPVNGTFVEDLQAAKQAELAAGSIAVAVSRGRPLISPLDSRANYVKPLNVVCDWESATSEMLYPAGAIDTICRLTA